METDHLNDNNAILKQMLNVVEKFLAGTVNEKELFTYLYITSKAKLNLSTSEQIDIEITA